MTHAKNLDTEPELGPGASTPEIRESGVVPAKQRGPERETLRPALLLTPPKPSITRLGAALAGTPETLLVAGRMDEGHPYAALYRRTDSGLVRERSMRGIAGRRGPVVASDGDRLLIGQPCEEGASDAGSATVYRKGATELEVEAQLEPGPDDPERARFGELAAIGHDLLVLGHGASLCAFRHSPVGWLASGQLEPPLAYEYNPELGAGLAVARNRVLVGNPVEIHGHRAGAGRVFVYRSKGDHMQLESVLSGDGIEYGREHPARLGFGASIQVADDLVTVTAPYEVGSDGRARSRVYVYRVQTAALGLMTRVEVPSCQYGACIVGDRLFCLGDALHVFARRGPDFVPLASYDSRSATTLAAMGPLVALGNPGEPYVALHFAAQF